MLKSLQIENVQTFPSKKDQTKHEAGFTLYHGIYAGHLDQYPTRHISMVRLHYNVVQKDKLLTFNIALSPYYIAPLQLAIFIENHGI